MSEIKENKNIYQRIIAIMADVDYIQKGPKKAGGMYTFVSHDAVSSTLHPFLVKHGVVVIPTVKSMIQEDNRTVMCLSVDFINADKPEERFTTESWGYGIDSSDKGPGKAYSYSFKYAMLKTFCLETGDDPDEDQTSKYEPSKQKSDYISDDQLVALEMYDTEIMKDFKLHVLKTFKIDGYSKLLAKDFNAVHDQMKKIFESRTKK